MKYINKWKVFESKFNIRNPESFKSYNHKGVQWVTDINYKIKKGEIPLTPSVVRKILGKTKVVETFHLTDENGIDNIKKIIGKRNSISTSSFLSKERLVNLMGVISSGGIIIKIEGILDFVFPGDLGSTVDPSLTRRWIDAALLSENLKEELPNSDVLTISQFKLYMSKLNELLDKYKDEIDQNLLNLIFSDDQNNDWNELLIRNIKVVDIAWKPQKIFPECFSIKKDLDSKFGTGSSSEDRISEFLKISQRCDRIIGEFENKLYSLSRNVTRVYYDFEILRWFEKRGGYLSMQNFKNNYPK